MGALSQKYGNVTPPSAPTAPLMTGISGSSPQITFPQATAQKQRLEQDIAMEGKIKEIQYKQTADKKMKEWEQEEGPLSGDKQDRFTNALEMIVQAKRLKTWINQDKINIKSMLIDPEIKSAIKMMNSAYVKLKSGSASSDKERAFLISIGPVMTDFISSFATGKPAKAVMINKLGQLYGMAKSLGVEVGGAKRLNRSIENFESASKEFIGETEENELDKRISELQERLNMRGD